MQQITNQQIFQKIQDLDYTEKKEINDFIDFLISRKKEKDFDKKKVLENISVWSEDDVKEIETVQRDFSKWKIEEF
jgi:hypothetical protein